MTGFKQKTAFSKSFNWISYFKNYEIQRKSTLSFTYSNLYHYAANNPVHYIDPDGNDINTVYFAGLGGKLVAGGDVSVGISWDDNGNVALAITGNLGVGVEANVDLPIAPSGSVTRGKNLNNLKGIGAFKVDGDASINGLDTSVGVVFGMSLDNESSEMSGWNLGIIGGGVNFASGTLYILLKNGVGDLVERYNSLNSSDQSKFLQELKQSETIPDAIKKDIIDAIEEAQQ